MKLTNKVVVISGAGRGVGRSIALALAPEKNSFGIGGTYNHRVGGGQSSG